MNKFSAMIGSGINLKVDTETDFVPTNRGEEKGGGFTLEINEDEEKVQTNVYMPKQFRKDFDKFIRRYGNVRGGRSEIICKMLQYAMDVIEKEDATK